MKKNQFTEGQIIAMRRYNRCGSAWISTPIGAGKLQILRDIEGRAPIHTYGPDPRI